MGQAEHEGGHIWLRQSATFSVNGQTRTVEIAIPLRPGADADEVERLLSEADAGMERLTRHLDDRVAALTDGVADTPATAPTRAQPAPAARPAVPAPSPTPAAAPAPDATPAAAAAPTPAAQRTPSAPANAPRSAATSQPAPATRPTPSPSPASAAGRSTGPLQAAAGAAGADISRIEFIKAAGELGLDVRQAMQRLGVRSLEGLNLRESLELLRRQALREDDEPAAPAPAPVSAPPAAARTSAATPPPAPRPAAAAPQPAPYFEEEDEPELTFTIDDDDELDDDYGAYPMGNGAREPVPAGENDYDEVDELELDDVPDFGPPPAAAGSAGRRIPAGRGPAASQAAPAAKPPAASAAATPSSPVSAASELIAHLRAAHPGGAMSSQQRKAYQNIVVDELGETRATGLIKGIWNVSPDRLGAEQADELLSWGKRETFADEVTQVLAELRAERERERSAGGTAGSGGASARATGSAPRGGTQTRTPNSRTPSGGGGF